MAENKGVVILAETLDGKLSPAALELLGGGRGLADELGEELSAVIMGSGIAGLAQDAIAYGADRVYTVDDPLLKDYQTETYVPVMEKVVKEASPNIVLMGQTAIGRDLVPRLAFRLEAGASMDCIRLEIDPETKLLKQTRAVYGGNALATYVSEVKPQMATVRAKVMDALPRDDSRKGEVVTIDAGLDPSKIRTKFIEKVKEEVVGIKLEDADVVVSGGRGMGDAEGFKELEKLAGVLRAAVGSSRPPCDQGWVPASMQVGLTGKIVSPTLYIAVGISGAAQHISGMSGSKNIVAINKDAEANIFKVAHYGVVGDWKKILPPFTEKVKELLG